VVFSFAPYNVLLWSTKKYQEVTKIVYQGA
jgi:hypothetical protein